MRLEDSVRYFTEETHILSCMSIACGQGDTVLHAMGGTADAAGTPVTGESLFDLASLTKLLTGLLVMRLHEEGLLDLSAPVTRYAPRFTALDTVTVDQVLGFEVTLKTPGRVDAASTVQEAQACLYAITAQENGTGRIYSDMPAMVLAKVIEGASGQRYMAALHRYILDPLGMADTFCLVPDHRRGLCVSCDREHRIERGRYILREGIARGTPHDPKARVINPEGDDCPGHAGLFSTIGDMEKLCRGLLDGRILSAHSLRYMARNRTGRMISPGVYTQYLGSQCYVKHPDQYYSEVPSYMSSAALAVSGFTGHHLSVDPESRIWVVYLGNRVLDRLTMLIPEEGKTAADYGLSPGGAGQVIWPDGRMVWSSAGYVHYKDEHFHAAVAEALGLK